MRRCMEERMKNEQEKSNNRLYIGIVIVALAFCAAYFLRSFGNEGGSNTDRAAEQLGGGIEQSLQSKRELQDGIGNATETVDRLADVLDRSETTVDAAKGTAESLDRNLETAADAVGKCQRIVTDIKRRNEERTPEP